MRRAALIVLVAASALVPAVGAAGAETPPNVLIFLTDDQRASTMSVMPETRFWFKQHGTTFPNGVVTTPVCCPSRSTILTGRYAHNHGVASNFDVMELDHSTTIQHRLQDAGYLTAMAGKYLNLWKESPPDFDRWAMMDLASDGNGYSPTQFDVNGTVRTIETYSTNYIRRKAIRFLERFETHDERPWFIFLSVYAPHAPAIPAPKYETAGVPKFVKNPAMLETDRTDKPPFLQARTANLATMAKFRARQLRTLMSVDDLVGRVMKTLGKMGERDDTLAFFLSDNGHLWGDHGLFAKRFPYTASVRVPFFARWPGVLPAGTADPRLVANVDLVPTILDAAGMDATGLDGHSLGANWDRDRVFLEYTRDPDSDVPTWASIRTMELQYTEYYGEGGAVVFREYYDLTADPWQLVNLLGDADTTNDPPPAVVDGLAAQVEADAACAGTEGPGACP